MRAFFRVIRKLLDLGRYGSGSATVWLWYGKSMAFAKTLRIGALDRTVRPGSKRSGSSMDLRTPCCTQERSRAQIGCNRRLSQCEQQEGRCHAIRGNAQNMGGLVEGWHEWSFWNAQPPLFRGRRLTSLPQHYGIRTDYPNLDIEPATTRRIAGSLLLRNHVAESGAISELTI